MIIQRTFHKIQKRKINRAASKTKIPIKRIGSKNGRNFVEGTIKEEEKIARKCLIIRRKDGINEKEVEITIIKNAKDQI